MPHTPDSLRAPTVDSSGRRRWIYPDRRSGRLSRIRGTLALVLMIIYLTAPFVTIRGLPLIRFDVLQGIVYAMGQSFRFADGSYLVFVLLAAALALAFVTTLWGRVWCGYACPQTVFVEWIIRPIEELIEGPALHRKRMDAGPKNFLWAAKKCLKYSLFFIVIWLISNAFLAYFIAPSTLIHWMGSSPREHPWSFGFMGLTFAALFFDLVWFREQFCSFLCPYARFQAVMISAATPTVAYDSKRGELRGRSKSAGDCIDCQLCVRVCPTGIDIRDGLQLECIQCGRCSDACDGIMKSLKRPAGLIRSTSQAQLEGRKISRFRLRPAIYLVLLLANIGLLSYLVNTRSDLKWTILRQARTTYVSMDPDRIANYFTLRVVNQSRSSRQIIIQAPADVQVICSICGQAILPNNEIKGNLVLVFPKNYFDSQVKLKVGEEEKLIDLPLLKPGN